MRILVALIVSIIFVAPAVMVHGHDEQTATASSQVIVTGVQSNITVLNSTDNVTQQNQSLTFNPSAISTYVIANSTDVLGFQAYAGPYDGGNATMPVNMIVVLRSPGPSVATIEENGTIIVSGLQFSNVTHYDFSSPFLNHQEISITITNEGSNVTRTTTYGINIMTTTNFIDYEWYQHKRPVSDPWNLQAYLTLGFTMIMLMTAAFLIFRYQRWQRTRNPGDIEDHEEGSGVWNR